MRATFLAAAAVLFGAQSSAAQVHGRVLAAETRKPVAGAMIRDISSGAHVLSDARGEWRLAHTDSASIRVEHIAYVPVQRTVVASAAPVIFVLDENVTEIDALVVTASRRVQKLKDAPVATELITRADIEQSGGSDVAAVLLERTGIELEGGHPAGSGAMLQGFGAERVLVLLDGQPLVGRMSGSFDLTRIPAGMLERIEVVKGPQSTLFGSEALGGVINLITRQAGGDVAVSADLLSGTSDRLDASGRVQGGVGRASFLVEGGRRQIGITPGITRDGGARNQQWDAMIKGNFAFSETARAEASALIVDESQRWQTGQLYNFADNLQWAARIGGSIQARAHTFTSTISMSEFRHTPARSTTEEVTVPGVTETQAMREAEVLHSMRAGRVVLDNGVELRDELLRSTNIRGGERSLSGIDAYSQLTWSLGALDVVPGVRFSTSEAWGEHWTPRLALLYRAGNSVALRGSLGSAFRAPAFKELFMSFMNLGAGAGYMVRGNEDLAPESSVNVSLGAEIIQPSFYARAQVFHNRFDDFIETQLTGDSAGFAVYSYGNIADGWTRGAELEMNTSWKGARLEAGYSYLQTEDDATDQPLLGRPAHTARLLAGYTFPFATRVSATAIYTGSTPMQRTTEGVLRREAYMRVDARVAHALPYGVELTLGVNNLGDSRPAMWPGYTGRQIYAGASWRSNDKGIM
jgi:outer membrane receptor for ferrienterochelin and colicins